MIVILIIIAALLLAILYVVSKIYQILQDTWRDCRAGILDFMRPGAENKPSQFAELVDSIGAVLAARVGTSVTASIRGAIGGAQKGINSDAAAEIASSSPQLSLISALAPKMFKKLGKNSGALNGLQGLLGNMFHNNSAGSDKKSPFSFKFK
jgi:hypothetical protein